MPVQENVAPACPDCGTWIEVPSTGDFGCMVCLLRVGLDDAEESANNDEAFAPPPDQFGPYTIARHEDGVPWELGRGAMGVTFRATDTSLRRTVALKIINRDFGRRGAEAQARFMREARLAAALRHPNVATVYHFGIREENGQCFCAMEFVEGETLEARVRRTGPLDALTTIEIALQISSALTAAEKQGLVHRDLKPANLMFTAAEAEDQATQSSKTKQVDFTIKVIDFGVAKAVVETPDTRVLTHSGFIGTPAFASPEQFTNAPLDVRSDIYSLGVTLWYLLTGLLPFSAASAETMSDNRRSAVLPLEQLKPAHLPPRLISLLVSMLALEPAGRPGARDLAARLEEIRAQLTARGKRWRRFALRTALVALGTCALVLVFHPFRVPVADRREVPGSDAPKKSLAVLPFENESEDKENASFADGIQDDVLTRLAKIKELNVISRSSVTRYRNATPRNLREIGRQLGVTHILEGSVRRIADRVLVNVDLIDARDDHQVWAERYDRTLADSLTLQGELASEIAAALRTTLSPEEKLRVETKPTENPDAYVLYLRARTYESRPDRLFEDYKLAEQLYGDAIRADPSFALAHARLSATIARIYHWFEATDDHKARMKTEAEKALQLRPDLGEGHFALGLYYYWTEVNYEKALKEFGVAAAVLPNESDIGYFTAAILRRQGHWSEHLELLKKTLTIDPQNAVHIAEEIAYTYSFLRDWPEAMRWQERLIVLAPDSVSAKIVRAYLDFWSQGSTSPLREVLRQIPPKVDPSGLVTRARWDAAMIQRDYAAADQALTECPLDQFQSVGLPAPESFYRGCVTLARGDQAAARTHFEATLTIFEAAVQQTPDNAVRHAKLGLVYSFIGRREEAIREGRRAIDLMPDSKDAVVGPWMMGYLAMIYARVGEADSALPLLEHLLASPGPVDDVNCCITRNDLRYRWQWDPLRNNPRFQKLLSEPASKTVHK